MTDMDIVLVKLDALSQRFDDERAMNVERHEENVTRLERIEGEVRKTNGRVTVLETINVNANKWPSLQVWLVIVAGTLTGAWFLLTQVLGFHK